MEPISLFSLIKQVITSWQVIFITIAVLLFISAVQHVSRSYHRPKVVREKKIKIKKVKEKKTSAKTEKESDNDDLGLEEE
ncbi:MAG: hypothetical protein LBC80_07310 [Treponema sp.]|jgi:predicted tellurium resistance membrane protein TerC|nr:hypothetical protein [Treponema sp.]